MSNETQMWRLLKIPRFLFIVALLCFVVLIIPVHCPGGEVLVFYANETAPDEWEQKNYETVRGWLESSPDSNARQLARNLEMDARIFPKVIDVELNEFETRVTTAGLVIFTNRLARQELCRIRKPGWESPRDDLFPVARSGDPVDDANPLARLSTFAAALKTVREHFPSEANTFVLCIKSHGSTLRIVTPRMCVNSERMPKEEFLSRIEGHGPIENQTAPYGIAARDLFHLLGSPENSKMRFPIILIESCQAAESIGEEPLPRNVDTLACIKSSANYNNILWADVLARGKREGVAKTLTESLSENFVVRGKTSQPMRATYFHKIIYFIPLVIWAALFIHSWRRTRSQVKTME